MQEQCLADLPNLPKLASQSYPVQQPSTHSLPCTRVHTARYHIDSLRYTINILPAHVTGDELLQNWPPWWSSGTLEFCQSLFRGFKSRCGVHLFLAILKNNQLLRGRSVDRRNSTGVDGGQKELKSSGDKNEGADRSGEGVYPP